MSFLETSFSIYENKQDILAKLDEAGLNYSEFESDILLMISVKSLKFGNLIIIGMEERSGIEMDKSIADYYNTYDEDGRLFRDYSHQIEWLTTMHFFDNIIPAHSKIFDGCAGTGNYAFKLAEQGHSVAASDIVPHNVDIMLKKQKNTPILEDIFVGDICACNHYSDHYFDAVLCMGAFYHLDEKKRYKAMEQCLRLLKNGGILVITYINLVTALHLHLMSGLENISEILKCYNMKSLGDSFVYMMPEEIETMAEKYKLKILHHITSDGNPFVRGSDFNKAQKEDFEKYMELHLKICENKSLIGYGLHGLVFLTNLNKQI